MSTDIKALKQKVDALAIMSATVEFKQRGNDWWACCPFHGEKTPSLKADQRQGEWLWKCFGCGEGGDIIKWLEKKENIDTRAAIARLEEIAGVERSGWKEQEENAEWREHAEEVQQHVQPVMQEKKETFKLSAWAGKVNALRNSPDGLAWLKDVRGLDGDTIERMQLGFVRSHKYAIHKPEDESARDKGWICFPRILKDKVVSVKLRSIVTKCFTQVAKMDQNTLFNVETITPVEPVYLTEGELDACVLEMAGFRAVSVQSAGAAISTQSRIELKKAERIFLAGDNDGGVGTEYMKKLGRELGENTHLLLWPDGVKDANDFFRDTCKRDLDLFEKRVRALAKEARHRPPEGFKPLQQALREGESSDMANSPDRFHFPPEMPRCDMMTYVSRGQILILYSTYSGTGKTMLKTQMLLAEGRRGEVVVDLSPEIRGQDYLNLVTSQILMRGIRRTGKVTAENKHEAADLLGDVAYYVGHNIVGTTEEEVLAFIESTIQATGSTIFAIDTFHRLIFASGSKNQAQVEGAMAKRIEALAIKYNTIFVLIGQSNAEAEGLDNLKKDAHGVLRGCRELTDVSSAVYLIHRKKVQVKEGDNPKDLLENEAILKCTKSRGNGGGDQIVKLLLQPENSTFVEVEPGTVPGDPGPQSQVPPEYENPI